MSRSNQALQPAHITRATASCATSGPRSGPGCGSYWKAPVACALARTAGYGVLRGSADAVSASATGWVIWWIQQH
ncbi:hypothetical protein [Streptomyces sp. NBC_00989]|uniref:hypothetical protein n=1 Tax=Streptomyces sp. NBC_00989 TaxID=2903705 RepID=UPI00386515BF|nr:hypothetical protein OG714_52415 [Streptomyces sp. NBC_00989]